MNDTRAVPMLDLRAQLQRIRPEVDEAVERVIASTQFIQGEDCRRLEEEFAAYCGASHACAVANGTDALILALRAYGVGPGDEVVTVANTFIATGEAILLNGATPVFVDVDPATFTMDAIKALAGRHGLPVLEDAAQAHGAELRGRRTGSLGHAACFSFYPSKNLGAYGDAGMVTASDPDFVARVRQLANHGGGTSKYDNVVLGTNSRLDSLQAAILRVKLRHLDQWNEERRERVRAYREALADVPGVVLPSERAGARSAWHLCTIRARDRDALAAHLKARGIATAIHYPRPIHLQPAMAAAGGRPGDLPVSEQLCREVLCLPLYPELPLEDLERIAAEVRAFCTAAVARA